MRQKESYTLEELYDNLAIPLTELSGIAQMTEVTLRRIRYGFPTRRSTINKLLLAFSKIYERELSLENVTGLHVEDRRGSFTKGQNTTEKAAKTYSLSETRQAEASQEKTAKRVYNRKQDTSLPLGCTLASKFATDHGIARPTFIGHMTQGLGSEKDKVDYSQRDKPHRPSEKEKYLTQQQQQHALEFWKRHRVNFAACNNPGCWCHTIKNGDQ